MTPADLAAFLGTMLVLAAIPSASVALVVGRAATGGFRHGVAVAAGIVAGDLLFLLLALLGLVAAAQWLGGAFAMLRAAGAAYLAWCGLCLLRDAMSPARQARATAARGGLAVSFGAGLLLTLGDLKAIVFYASLLPLFIDVASVTSGDAAVLLALTVIGVGGVKVIYAALAHRVSAQAGSAPRVRWLRGAAGVAMVGVGGYVIARS